MVRLAHYMGIVYPGGAFEVSTTSIQLFMYILQYLSTKVGDLAFAHVPLRALHLSSYDKWLTKCGLPQYNSSEPDIDQIWSNVNFATWNTVIKAESNIFLSCGKALPL